MKKNWFFYGLAFIGGLTLIFLILSFILSALFLFKGKEITGPSIGVLEIKGIILESGKYLKIIRKFERNHNIKAVVLRIDSPGGAVGASQEIYRELKKLRKIKPVVVSMGNVAASGAFYVSLGGKKIFASPGTLTGSIGVILQIPNIKKLLDKLGIKTEIIKSGAYKASGSIFKELSPEEKKYLQSEVRQIHLQFINVVAKERKLSLEKVRKIADGRIFTGEEALRLGLIDEIGNFWDAVEEAKKMAHLKKAQILYFPKKEGFLYNLLKNKTEGIYHLFSKFVFKPFYLMQ
jgi:protease-4